jgi:hypothetical protein
MAYITTANANSIIYKIDVNSLKINGELYKIPIYFFNKYEEKSLLAIKELFLDSENFLTEYYKPILTRDTLNFVFEGKPPAYHKTIDCNRISSDYENFQIPETIKDKGKETVKKFRKWFLENQYLLDKPDIFIARLKMKWGIVSNLKNVNKDNSGYTKFENLTPKQIEERIDSLIKRAGRLYYEETEILKRFNKYAYLGNESEPIKNNNTGFSDRKVKEVLSFFENNIKKPLKPLLIEYFRVTINPELNLNDRILEQLGFKPCQQCHKLKNVKPNQIISNRTLKGFPLYEAVPNVNAVETYIIVRESKNNKLYFAIETPDGDQLVRSTGTIFDRLTLDEEFEVGQEVLASIYLRQAIPGLTAKDLDDNYGPDSRNPNKFAIDNYLKEVKGGYNHFYCNEIIEDEDED